MYSTCPPTRRIGIQTKRCGTTSNTKNSRDTRPRPKRRSRSWPNVSSPAWPRTLNCSGESISGAVLQIYCLEPYYRTKRVGQSFTRTYYPAEMGEYVAALVELRQAERAVKRAARAEERERLQTLDKRL